MANVGEGTKSEYIKLIASDGHEFKIKRTHALYSETISTMLSTPSACQENATNTIHFKNISSHILHLVCTYFEYKDKYKNSEGEIPPFPVELEDAIDLLMASDFLKC